MNNPIDLNKYKEDKNTTNKQVSQMLQNCLVNIIKLQLASEDFLGDELPMGQLRQMEENITRLLEEAGRVYYE